MYVCDVMDEVARALMTIRNGIKQAHTQQF